MVFCQRIINIERKPGKYPVCGERIVDIIYGTGDMTEIDFMLKYRKDGIFENWGTEFHLHTNEYEELMKKNADSPILKRKIPADLNFIMKGEVKCVGIKRILSSFINNLQQQYAKQYEESSPSEVKDLIVKEWKTIKSKFGDKRRTTITIVR